MRQGAMQRPLSSLMTMITNRFLLMKSIIRQFLKRHMFSSASNDIMLALQFCVSFVSFSSVFSPKGDTGQQNYIESSSLLQSTYKTSH